MTIRFMQMNNRQFFVVLFVLWGIWLAAPNASYVVDDLIQPQPWFAASIALRETPGEPVVIYTRQIERVLAGEWQAWMEIVDPQPPTGSAKNWKEICGSDGDSTYFPFESGATSMSLLRFIGRECPVPDQVWRLCASWTMADVNTGRTKPFPDVCSLPQPGG